MFYISFLFVQQMPFYIVVVVFYRTAAVREMATVTCAI